MTPVSQTALSTLLLVFLGACAAPKVEVDPKELLLELGEVATINARTTGTLFQLNKPNWSTEDYRIATVDDQGRVTAMAHGRTTIVATLGDETTRVPVAVGRGWVIRTASNMPGSAVDTVLTLFESDGTTQKGEADGDETGATALYSRLSNTLFPGKTYLLRVKGKTGTAVGPYALCVYSNSRPAMAGSNGTAGSPDTYEPNEMDGSATTLTVGIPIYASLTTNDTDFYRFTVP